MGEPSFATFLFLFLNSSVTHRANEARQKSCSWLLNSELGSSSFTLTELVAGGVACLEEGHFNQTAAPEGPFPLIPLAIVTVSVLKETKPKYRTSGRTAKG